MTDEDIDFSDNPEVDSEWFDEATLLEGHSGLASSAHLIVAVPTDVSDWYRSAPEGYDEAVAAALPEYVTRHPRS